MGKLLETLRRIVQDEKRAAAEEEAPAEMPFIEVGPRRLVLGSPDVMAALPGTPTGVEVAFRRLPGREPAARIATELVAYHAPAGQGSLRYCELLGSLLEAAGKSALAGQVLLFTSQRGGTGTTTVVLNVGITAARQGKSVLVVEANADRPAVSERLGLPRGPGLAEVLAGHCAIERALHETAQVKMQVLPAGGPPGSAGAEALRSFVRQLRGQYDLVLIDAAPWGPALAALAPACEAVFLVVKGSEVESAEVAALTRQLPARGVPLAGTVLSGL